MQSRFWRWWGGVIVEHPKFVVVSSLLIIACFGVAFLQTPKNLSFTGLLGEDEPELALYKRAIRTFGHSSSLAVLIEGEPADVDTAAALLIKELPKRTPLRSITPPADPYWAIERAPWLWPSPVFESALRAVSSGDPRQIASVEKTLLGIEAIIHRQARPHDRALMIYMEFKSDPFDMAMGSKDYYLVEEATAQILDEAGLNVSFGFTGLAALGAQDQVSVMSRIRLLTPLTLIAVLLLVRGVETRPTRLLLAAATLGGSVLVAFGGVGIALGKLSIAATFFGMLLLGLGIDFAIHLLVAMRDNLSHGLSPEASVRQALHHSGSAIVLGGLTTAVATLVVSLVPEPGALDMGLTATFGVVASLILMLSMLPAGWLLLERVLHHADPPPRFQLPGLRPAVSLSLRYPRSVLAAAVLLCIISIVGLRDYRMETDLEKIFTKDVPALKVTDRISELFGVSTTVFLAQVDSLEQAREWSERLMKEPDIVSVYSAATWIQSDSEERAEKLDALFSQTSAIAPNPVYDRLHTAWKHGPIRITDLPSPLRSGIIGENGELALRIVPKLALLEARSMADQNARLRSIAPTITGIPFVAQKLMIENREWIPILVAVIMALLVLMIAVSFRNPADILLALLPVGIAGLAAFGLFCLFGFSYSVLTTVIVPVILGLGIDDGIHVVERLRRGHVRDDEAIHDAVEGVGRAIFLTSATTTVSFVGLFFSNHYGLESIAQFMIIGVPLCFVTSVTVLPAAAKLLAERPRKAPKENLPATD